MTAVVIGFGGRGSTSAYFAVTHPEELEIAAIAEPNENHIEVAKKRHHLKDEQIYRDWEDLAAQPKLADIAIIATQDNMHYGPAMALIQKGYHLLLEKPMAQTAQECKAITEAAERHGVKVVLFHVLRFSKFWCAVKDIIDNGDLGEIQSVIHMEGVGNIRQAHSYVRGNWRKQSESSPMLLAKSSHDLDLLQWLIGKHCKRVQSFGRLTHFTAANRPEGAPDYCIQGCPVADTCCYNAEKIYCGTQPQWRANRCAAAKTLEEPTQEQCRAAITDGPYGRCVYACDNDVVDHQVVNMEFEGGCTATFTMNAFNHDTRYIRIFGTKGELVGDMNACKLEVFSFATRETKHYDPELFCATIDSGHGGGDAGIMTEALKYFRGEDPGKSICSVRTSYLNHLIGFAAEESRLNGTVVDLDAYENRIADEG